MRKIIYFVICAICLSGALSFSTISAKEIKKTRKEQKAEYKKEIDAKASKTARKRAKELTKQGWRPIGTGKPIEAQLDRAWPYEEPNEDGVLEYIVQPGTAISNTLETAQSIAKRNAQLALAKSLESEMTSIAEGTMDRTALSDDEIQELNEMQEVNHSFVQKTLKKTILLGEWYRKTDSGKYEVQVTMAVKIATFKEEAKEAWLNEVKAKNEELRNKLNDRLDKISK